LAQRFTFHYRAVRPAKISAVKEVFASFGEKIEIVPVDDIVNSDLSEALKGVDAVEHIAAPLSTRGEPGVIVSGAVDGTVNVLRQAYAAGVRKFVVTSSIVAVFDIKHIDRKEPYTENDWNPVTLADAEKADANGLIAYLVGKTVAEQELWKFADENSDADITTGKHLLCLCVIKIYLRVFFFQVNPPYLFGPFVPGFKCPEPDTSALSTTYIIAKLLNKERGQFPSLAGIADVRDVARVHVLALETGKPPADIPRKRVLISDVWIDFGDIVRWIVQRYPELEGRTVDPDKAPKTATGHMVDMSISKALFGIGSEELRSWKETIGDTVDALLALEKEWSAKGLALPY
jgi:nucleoside-diphosphate-sugar epimerase